MGGGADGKVGVVRESPCGWGNNGFEVWGVGVAPGSGLLSRPGRRLSFSHHVAGGMVLQNTHFPYLP